MPGLATEYPENLDLAPPKAALIVLTHNPDIFPGLPASVPLTLLVHSWRPGEFSRRCVWCAFKLRQRYAAGHVQREKHLFVTTALAPIFPCVFACRQRSLC